MCPTGLAAALVAAVLSAPPPPLTEGKAPAGFSPLLKRYEGIQEALDKGLAAAKDDADLKKANERYRKEMEAWHDDALSLIRKHPAEPAALAVIERYLRGTAATNELIAIVRTHHLAHPKLGSLLPLFADAEREAPRAFARELAEKHPDKAIRGQACLLIGQAAKWAVVEDAFPRIKGRGRPGEERLVALRAEADEYLRRAARRYAAVPTLSGNETVGACAAAELVGLKNLPNLRAGKAAPEIEGEDLDGKKLRLSDHKGKVVLLVFWASWCGPCMRDVPHERELVRKFAGRPFVLVGVNGDTSREPAKAAVTKAKITWRSFASSKEGGRGPIPLAWNVRSWPTTYLIDHAGIIRHRNLRQKQLDAPAEDLVAEAEKAARDCGR